MKELSSFQIKRRDDKMLENLLGLTIGASMSDLGIFAAITSIIVEFLKQILPQSFPTKILTLIVGIIVCIIAYSLCYGFAIKIIGVGIITGFITAFIAMNGFDSFKSILERFTSQETKDDVGEG